MKQINEGKAKEALQGDETQLFRSLADHTPDGIFVVDPQTGRLLDVNRSVCDSLGYTREELLTMGVGDLNESWTPERIAGVWMRRCHDDIVTLEAVNCVARGGTI